MAEYNCYDYAIELGFTEEEAKALQASKVGKGQDASVLRRLAKVKNLPSTRKDYPMPPPELSPGKPQSTPSPVTSTVKGKVPSKKKKAVKR